MEQLEADVKSLVVSESAPSWKRRAQISKYSRTAVKERAEPGKFAPHRVRAEAAAARMRAEAALARKRAAPFGYFFDLPIELREEIYKLALFGRSQLEDTHYINIDGQAAVWLDRRTGAFQSGLVGRVTYKKPLNLNVSKKFHAEAGAIYYRSTRFMFDEFEVCGKWLASLDKNFRDAIRHLCYCSGTIRDVIQEGNHRLTAERQAKSLGQDWKTLHDYFLSLGMNMTKGLQFCGNEKVHTAALSGELSCKWEKNK